MKPTVGQQLQHARNQAGISLDDAAHELHIRAHYLQNLEDDHPELLNSAAQARGFLRLYAEFLGLSYADLLALWEASAAKPPVELAAQAGPLAESAPKSPLGWLKKLLPERPEEPESSVRPPADEPDQLEGEPVMTDDAEDVRSEADFPAPISKSVSVEEGSLPSPELPADIELDGNQPSDQAPPNQISSDEIPTSETSISEISAAEPLEDKLPAGIRGVLLQVVRWLASFGHKISSLLPFLRRRQNAEDSGEEGAGQITSLKNQPPQTSQDIFNQIGTMLQTRRKAMELSLADIENFTNLKRAFLIALEEGHYDVLPSTVQGRGMLNNYAQFLGMEETALMDLFSQALQLQREERLRPQRKTEKPAVSVNVNLPERWRKIINPDLIIGSILIIGLFVFIIWGATQVFSHSSGGPTEAPSISEMLQNTPSESPAPNLAQTEQAESTAAAEEVTPLPGVAVVEATPTIVATVNTAPLQVVIIAHDRAFLRVTVDGAETFSGRVVPDNVYTYSGNVSVNLLTGNASALEVYFNQDYVGNLGDVGEVINIDFTLDGLITPTPAATQTPTLELPTPEAEATEAAPTEVVPTEAAPTE
jgi:cytoskeletal protein RodZ